MKAYLAGPDVFYPTANRIGDAKKMLCCNHGVEGLFPLDNEVKGSDLGYAIFRANKWMMDRADFCIANLTPFRGPSADVGTVMEMGYMIGQGKPVFAYTNDPQSFFGRTREWFGAEQNDQGTLNLPIVRDGDGMTIENFGLHDNLMIDGFIRHQGFSILSPDMPFRAVADDDLSVFERCLKSAVDNMHFRIRAQGPNYCGEIPLSNPIPVHVFGDK